MAFFASHLSHFVLIHSTRVHTHIIGVISKRGQHHKSTHRKEMYCGTKNDPSGTTGAVSILDEDDLHSCSHNSNCLLVHDGVASDFGGSTMDDALSEDPLFQEDNEEGGEEEQGYGEEMTGQIRTGTTASARFNLLSTMVGGGTLSLPYAFAKAGNALTGPILLLVTAAIAEFSFRILVHTAKCIDVKSSTTFFSLRRSKKNRQQTKNLFVGRDSFESIAMAAFGFKGRILSMILVTLFCFFTTVGYGVVLRDLLQPFKNALDENLPHDGPFAPAEHVLAMKNNALLWIVVVLVTPLCTLQTLTSLQRFGAVSMIAILILGCCIVIRFVQCFLSDNHDKPQQQHQGLTDEETHWTDAFDVWPPTRTASSAWWREILTVLPIYIYCYTCHFSVLTIHNEFRQPTKRRVQWWLRSSTGLATLFYLIVGVAGSAFGARCTTTGQVQANILLDMASPLLCSVDDEGENCGSSSAPSLLFVCRVCMAITLTIAFPMVVIPARDMILRCLCDDGIGFLFPKSRSGSTAKNNTKSHGGWNQIIPQLEGEPFLQIEYDWVTEEEEEHVREQDDELRTPLLLSSSAPSSCCSLTDQSRELGKNMDMDAFSPPAGFWENTEEQLRMEEGGHYTTRHVPTDKNHIMNNNNTNNSKNQLPPPFWMRWVVATVLFWSAIGVASCVDSIDVVWDLLGSSFAILLSVLVPMSSFLILSKKTTSMLSTSTTSTATTTLGGFIPGRRHRAMTVGREELASVPEMDDDDDESSGTSCSHSTQHECDEEDTNDSTSFGQRLRHVCSRGFAWTLILVFVPLMVSCTTNAVYNTFFATI